MNLLAFDIEYHRGKKAIVEYGLCDQNGNTKRGRNVQKLVDELSTADIAIGHNIVHHDLKILSSQYQYHFDHKKAIDTIFLSTLLYAEKPYHKLNKDYYSFIHIDEIPNPVLDSKKTLELYWELKDKWYQVDPQLQEIYQYLLSDQSGFAGFFRLITDIPFSGDIEALIKSYLQHRCCRHTALSHYITNHPLELAYAIAIIDADNEDSILPAWLIHTYPVITEIISRLRFENCNHPDCSYCATNLSALAGLRKFFGYPGYRSFSEEEKVPLQQVIVEKAIDRNSLLAVLPTGGGKSLCYQVPALLAHGLKRSLTVVISPLQSLMKDQVDQLHRKGIFKAFTINGLVDPITRAKAVEAVGIGSAAMLYISPESLRSNTILRLLLSRDIERFVIDEAHCFSSWGHDFRPDYMYIAQFIQKIQEKQIWNKKIPISCFTATAKPEVVEDISKYFNSRLGQDLYRLTTKAKRTNLSYQVHQSPPDEKFDQLLELIEKIDGPTIVYASRVKRCVEITERLQRYQKKALEYHGQLDPGIKRVNQEKFMSGEVDIMVATSAFGMGVDKSDITNVIHYEISPSLENYVQEAGRAGRDANISANCYVLYDESDLQKHFSLLNATKLNKKDISQIWRAIKLFKRKKFSKSALEIAEKAGWDLEMRHLETIVKTAIANLEEEGFVKREENATRLFAKSILTKNFDEARQVIEQKMGTRNEKDIQTPIRIMQYLVSRSDTQVDAIAYHLGLEIYLVGKWINKFKDWGLVGDTVEIEAMISMVKSKNSSSNKLEKCLQIERCLVGYFRTKGTQKIKVYLKEIHDTIDLEEQDLGSYTVLEKLIHFWELNRQIRKKNVNSERYWVDITFKNLARSLKHIEKRNQLSAQIFDLITSDYVDLSEGTDQLVKAIFSVTDIQKKLKEKQITASATEIEEALFFMVMMEVISLEGGLMVFYNPMRITVLKEPKIRYTKENFQNLQRFYQSKTEQVHIAGEYAKKMMRSHFEALQYVDDYFQLDYDNFLSKYFKGKLGKIRRPITEDNFRKIMGTLSIPQTTIVKDNQSERILVAAGPGSGKTKVLVHKVAHIMMIEDVRPEQFLMLTFSRPAALEMRHRLKELIGSVYGIEIKTFHSYAFDIVGRVGDLAHSENIIPEATEQLKDESQYIPRIGQKEVILIDEYQDIDQSQFDMVNEIVKIAENARVIVVGDDDQNIYSFRGSSTKFMMDFKELHGCQQYALTKNWRSKVNLVDLFNAFLKSFPGERVKDKIDLQAHDQRHGILELHRYPAESHPFNDLVSDIESNNHQGTTAILTRINDHSLLLHSLFMERNIPVQLVAQRNGYHIKNLIEFETFNHWLKREADKESGQIDSQVFDGLVDKMKTEYVHSKELKTFLFVVDLFKSNRKYLFKADWFDLINQLRPEDLVPEEKGSIWLSTMHKSKGKEFDTVYLYLDNYQLNSPDEYRLFYVAMTRAKSNLKIFANTNFLNGLFSKHGLIKASSVIHPQPNEIKLMLGLKDINLWSIKKNSFQKMMKDSHPQLIYNFDDQKGSILVNRIHLGLSKNCKDKLNKHQTNGYAVIKIEHDVIVIWRDPDEEFKVGYRVPLVMVTMRRE